MDPTHDIPEEHLAIGLAVKSALDDVEDVFDAQLRSDLPPVQNLVEHIEAYRGKMLRPTLVILCGLASLPGDTAADPLANITRSHIVLAAVCEMIHMATLVHDDVLDEADLRRKGATVNRLRGNEAAVILGDYLFSSAFHLCSSLDSQAAALLIGETGRTLCAGELLQLHHRENFSIDEPTYQQIVDRKTASLIAASCRLGAMQSGAATEVTDRFARYGRSLGIAFQIQDDLLDLTGAESVVGKPLRRDAELGKLTLPIIHHLSVASPTQRGRTLKGLEHGAAGSIGQEMELLSALESTGSIAHAHCVAQRLVTEAKTAIYTLADTSARRMLLWMADQVVNRTS